MALLGDHTPNQIHLQAKKVSALAREFSTLKPPHTCTHTRTNPHRFLRQLLHHLSAHAHLFQRGRGPDPCPRRPPGLLPQPQGSQIHHMQRRLPHSASRKIFRLPVFRQRPTCVRRSAGDVCEVPASRQMLTADLSANSERRGWTCQ